MDNNDKLYNFLSNFNNQSLDQQGEFTGKLDSILDILSEGVWDSKGGTHDELFHITQCVFCCCSPESSHGDFCPVKLAKETRDMIDDD